MRSLWLFFLLPAPSNKLPRYFAFKLDGHYCKFSKIANTRLPYVLPLTGFWQVFKGTGKTLHSQRSWAILYLAANSKLRIWDAWDLTGVKKEWSSKDQQSIYEEIWVFEFSYSKPKTFENRMMLINLLKACYGPCKALHKQSLDPGWKLNWSYT